MNWLNRIRPKGSTATKNERANSVPEGLWKNALSAHRRSIAPNWNETYMFAQSANTICLLVLESVLIFSRQP